MVAEAVLADDYSGDHCFLPPSLSTLAVFLCLVINFPHHLFSVLFTSVPLIILLSHHYT